MTSLQKFLTEHSERKTSNPITIKTDNVFTFGKYKNRTYDEIYNTDKSYIAYILTADPKFWRRPQLYLMRKIEEDYETKI
jgi:putative ubiquitin-RnfH superfamily antitoxin RatB of RatAB toxin-antitoxin module